MGILKEDKKSRKRKRDNKSCDESLVKEQKLNESQEEDILTKDVDLLSPEQKSAKKRRKNIESDSFKDAETPVKSKEKVKVKTPVESVDKEEKTKKGKKEKKENLSSPKEKKSKKNKDKVSSIKADEELEKEESAKKKKVKKGKKSSSFGVVDSKLLEKSGGEVTSNTPSNPGRPTRINRAVDYLHQWKKDKKTWKFNKNFQSLLIKAIYNPVIIDDDDFETSLLYFGECQGGAREKLRTDAMALIKDDDHLAEPVDADMERRAREILQMLG